MPEKKKTQKTSSSDKTKRRKQQPTQKRKVESSLQGRVQRTSTAKNSRREENPRISLPNPRRIQKHSKIYSAFIAALFIIIGAVLFLVLFTFSAADPESGVETASTLFGPIGAILANVLLTLFGMASFLFSAVCLLMGISTACGKQFEVSPSELIGLCLLILGSSPLLALAFEGSQILEHAPGGVLGEWLSSFGIAHMPTPGFVVLCLVSALFGGLLVTDTRLKSFFLGLWKIVRWTVVTLFNALAQPFKKPTDESDVSIPAVPDSHPKAVSDESLTDSIFYEDSPSQLLDDNVSELEEREALALKDSRSVQDESGTSESDELSVFDDSRNDISEDELLASDDSDAMPSVDDEADDADAENADEDNACDVGEIDDPDNLHELSKGDIPSVDPRDSEKEKPAPKAEKTEALADIMSRIRKGNAPKSRSIAKRNHSVPALEPEFEFDSILAPEQIGKTGEQDKTQGTPAKSAVLGNWKPRSITQKKVSLEGLNADPVPRSTERQTLAIADIPDPVARKVISVPAPELPTHMTKDLLAQLATEEIDLSAADQARPNAAVTRIAGNPSDVRKLDEALADTAEIRQDAPKRREAVISMSPDEDRPRNAWKNEVAEKSNDDVATKPPKAEASPESTKAQVPVSDELRALMNEAGFRSPRKPVSQDYSDISFDDDFSDSAESLRAIDAVRSSKASQPQAHGEFVVAQEKKRVSEAELREAEKARSAKSSGDEYHFPPLSLLHYDPSTQKGFDNDALKLYANKIEEKLAEYHIQGQVVQICPGPIITRFEFQPAPGTKVSKIASLSDDLMMALEIASIRILAPIPGKGVVGIEIPNEKRNTIYLKEIIGSKQFTDSKSILTIALGKDAEGEPVVSDLAKMPHLLVAGSTGSGKSVGINTMICSLLYNASPDDVKFILVDPKCLELSVYEGIPHLLVPPITTPAETSAALDWACEEMDERYRKLSAFGVRNIKGYNEQLENPTLPKAMELVAEKKDDGTPKYTRMPYIVIVVDEFADLMMTAGKEIERSIARLAQKARAAGIHIILATQRPSTNVITGVIKANFPTRLAFRVFSYVDSRTILDTKGAESLLGMGDSLFLPPNTGILQRVHGAYVSDEEVQSVVSFLSAQRSPEYNMDITAPKDDDSMSEDIMGSCSSDLDPLYDQAVQIVAETRQASASFLQRRLSIGFNRAARLIEQLEREGVVGPQKGQKPREVLINPI